MPCFNEESSVERAIRQLLTAFGDAGHPFQLVTVDNGSSDGTTEILRRLAAEHPALVYHRLDTNQGYGCGILSGVPFCTKEWIGIIHADSQVDAGDVVRLYETILPGDRKVLAKVRRRFRMDGLLRKVLSICYNLLFRALWPTIRSIDVNGNPKILPRETLAAMRIRSTDWCIDPELLIKADQLRMPILEFSVFARMRNRGTTHVRPAACWELFRMLISFRFLRHWRQDLQPELDPVDLATAPPRRRTS